MSSTTAHIDETGTAVVEVLGEGTPARCTPGVLAEVAWTLEELGRRAGELRGLLLHGQFQGAARTDPDAGTDTAGPDVVDPPQAAILPVRERLWRLEVPSIALLTGETTGPGLALALACDLRLATPVAVFAADPRPQEGLSYGLPALLTKLAGRATAVRLLLGERLTADEAWRAGLVTRVVAGQRTEEEMAALFAHVDGREVAQALSRSIRSAEELDLAEAARFGVQLARTIEGSQDRAPTGRPFG